MLTTGNIDIIFIVIFAILIASANAFMFASRIFRHRKQSNFTKTLSNIAMFGMFTGATVSVFSLRVFIGQFHWNEMVLIVLGIFTVSYCAGAVLSHWRD